MIKYLSLLLLVLVLEGCNDDKPGTPSAEKVVGSGIGKIEVDHCEYVYYTLFGNAVSIVHAGNCHNPIHHLYADTAVMKVVVVDTKTGALKKTTWNKVTNEAYADSVINADEWKTYEVPANQTNE